MFPSVKDMISLPRKGNVFRERGDLMADPRTWNFWAKELAVYRNIEYWGLSLVMAGIGAVTYQLVEWRGVVPDHTAPGCVVWIPLLAGAFGMAFLTVVNLRGSAYSKLRHGEVYGEVPVRGWLGRMIATAPLLAGASGSWVVGLAHASQGWRELAAWVAAGLFALLAIRELVHRHLWNQFKKSTQFKGIDPAHRPTLV